MENQTTSDTNTTRRVIEKVNYKEFVNPGNVNSKEKREYEREREDPQTAEEFCRFSMRVQDHLKAARLDNEQTEVLIF